MGRGTPPSWWEDDGGDDGGSIANDVNARDTTRDYTTRAWPISVPVRRPPCHWWWLRESMRVVSRLLSLASSSLWSVGPGRVGLLVVNPLRRAAFERERERACAHARAPHGGTRQNNHAN